MLLGRDAPDHKGPSDKVNIWRKRSLKMRTLLDRLYLEKESSSSVPREENSRWSVLRHKVSTELSTGHWQLQKQQLLQRHCLSHLLLPKEKQTCKVTRADLTL